MSRLCFVAALFTCLFAATAGRAAESAVIVHDKDASFAARLAAKEVRRYVYLRTRELLPIVDAMAADPKGAAIVVGRGALRAAGLQPPELKPEQYSLKSVEKDGRRIVYIVGGDDAGTLYGAYRFAEHLGVRFYLHGDVVPDRQVALQLPVVDEIRKPLFSVRGIQPFHDFPEGPDWWSRDGYKAVLGQLPKLGMNFIGLHTYPEGRVGPEPLVWIGTPDESAPDGKVKASYPAGHYVAGELQHEHGAPGKWAWGHWPVKTSDYAFGAAEMFDGDTYGAEYMRGADPWNSTMSPEQCNAVFDRMGEFLDDVFTFARRLGIKTCVGTETPLVIPTPVKERLKAAGKDPKDPAVVQEVYEGMFLRIAKIHPLDYYWLWTPESWTWRPVKQEAIDATIADFQTVLAAMAKVKSPFKLATCGWVLGPPQEPPLFDQTLPKTVAMGCISRLVGFWPIEPGFAAMNGRPKWAIPWMEDDGSMTTPQLWVGRMRRDAYDALQYGCTGLSGIHWRTRVIAPNVAALAHAAWDQQGWSEGAKPMSTLNLPYIPSGPAPSYHDYGKVLAEKGRSLPATDFYADWALAEFGPDAAPRLAALFSQLDGVVPRPASWVTGPGSIKPDDRPWEEVQKEYAFVDELAALRPQVAGPGNLERFDYWLNNFQYLRAMAEVRCVWGRLNEALAKAKAKEDPGAQKKLAREAVLPIRKELVAACAKLHRHLMATVSSPGEMGTVCNWQQQIFPVAMTQPGRELAKLLGEDLPADAEPSRAYTDPARMFVRDVRTGLDRGEPFELEVVVLGDRPQAAELRWRPLGAREFLSAPLTHVARGVYHVALPADAVTNDFEYHVRATVGGKTLVFPATAPAINQTVVVTE